MKGLPRDFSRGSKGVGTQFDSIPKEDIGVPLNKRTLYANRTPKSHVKVPVTLAKPQLYRFLYDGLAASVS